MKPPHELDERVVVAETVSPRAMRGYHHGAEEPKVSSQPSNIEANGDDPLPMPLYLVLNGEGNEISKVDDVLVPQRWRESRCLGMARIVGGHTCAVPNSGTLSWRTNPPRQNWTVLGSSKGWRIFVVGLEEDDAPFIFFEAGTTAFLPREDDMVPVIGIINSS
ncbi:hypothetical protein GOBAR_AA34525 [Gossypium barbadense]|uniref:Uncharacterized protein n=1 Tax=Gossypium barbadense TaxID=3634 RepID=A0A2P5W524_GOSBA|nr:hypothetical protein GOBAR_AA34525 [Gossypium barbadense]